MWSAFVNEISPPVKEAPPEMGFEINKPPKTGLKKDLQCVISQRNVTDIYIPFWIVK